jgi:hypothetical protein
MVGIETLRIRDWRLLNWGWKLGLMPQADHPPSSSGSQVPLASSHTSAFDIQHRKRSAISSF